MTTTTTPNMGMILPVPSSEAGPAWASELITALTNILDSHDHSSGKGVKITPAGLNINSDFSFSSHAITDLQKTVFTSQAGALSGANFCYVLNGDLYFIDGSGNSVRVTAGGSINVASSGGFGGDYISSGAVASFTNATKYYSFKDGSAVKGIIDSKGQQNDGKLIWTTTAVSSSPYTVVADDAILLVDTTSARTVNLPDPTASKRVIWVVDVTGNLSANNITIHRFGSEKIQNVAADFLLKRSYGVYGFISDLTNWSVIGQSYPDTTSFAAFDGPTAAGSDSLTLSAWTSPTLSAPATTAGALISQAANTITFPLAGLYSVQFFVQNLVLSGGATTHAFGVRLRDTTAGATLGIGYPTNINTNSTYTNVFLNFFARVTSAANSHQFQYFADETGGVPAASWNNTGTSGVGGEANSPRWRITFRRLGD